MNTETDANWHQPLWSFVLTALPATVTVNLKKQCYAVRDNSQMCIYADDITEAGFETMTTEWAGLLKPRSQGAFLKALSLQRLMRAWNDGRRGYSVEAELTEPDGRHLTVSVSFEPNSREMIVIFHFDVK